MRLSHNWMAVAVALLAVQAACGIARAHEIRPAIVTVAFPAQDRVEISITANLEALMAGIGPQHKDSNDAPEAATYNSLRALPADALAERFRAFAPTWLEGLSAAFDGARVRLDLAAVAVPDVREASLARIATLRLAGTPPAGARTFQWTYPSRYGSSVLRMRNATGEVVAVGWLKDGETSEPVPVGGATAKGTLLLFAEYAAIGFTHILPKGLDHILFVLGLFFLSARLRPLLVQVTAFTVAHSITLALGLYGIVTLSPALVEPLIAVSIVYVAVENLLTPNLTPWRPLIVFGFGLLHGLGFAGVLQEVGLPRADYALGLVAFNIGVEGGQLAVIALAWALVGAWFSDRIWYRHRVVWPVSAAIALIGAYWTIERMTGA